MNKFITTTIVAATALTSTIAAAHDAPQTFTRDGQTYVYTSSTDKTKQVIDGYNQGDGSRFHLVVRDGVVSGMSNGREISFRVSEASSARPIETAAR
ncbi:hypothetical protein [Sphingomonas bacterium]|uniref:hypothetical protein n=1 Tax=Sphingomonas bacterium TaxID=1895847 RepID=UPI0015769EEC|nr:hypothetical protein [Sphingomonas bacterium]